jgi:hypothetical protein
MIVASGKRRSTSDETASSRRSSAPEAATMTGSTTSGSERPARKSATVSMIGALKSMPVFAASVPMSSKTASSWARMKSSGTS